MFYSCNMNTKVKFLEIMLSDLISERDSPTEVLPMATIISMFRFLSSVWINIY